MTTVPNDTNNLTEGQKVWPIVRYGEQSKVFTKINFEDLPEKYQQSLDSVYAELLDPARGRVIIYAEPQAGKSFLINQIVHNEKHYTESKFGTMYFFYISPSIYNEIHGFVGNYISAICDSFDCAETSLCFVTEDPSIATAFVTSRTNVRIMLEMNTSSLDLILRNENEGNTKGWSTYHVELAEIGLTDEELVSTLMKMMKKEMKKTFNVTLTNKRLAGLIDFFAEQAEIFDEENLSLIPLGAWAVIVRRMCGLIGLSSSREIIDEKGQINMDHVYETIYKEQQDLVESYVIDEENIKLMLPNGEVLQLASNEKVKKNKEEKPIEQIVFNSLSNIEKALNDKILGQDEALETVIDGMIVPMAKMNKADRPLRSFLFCGQTGVGKTQTAITLAENIADKPLKLVRIDMSEYAQKHEAVKLFGAPPGYVGFEGGGILTSAVTENPNCVVLLDEIEKAHPDVWNSFLQVLDAGRMTDGQGNVADFTQCILIMTSNVGAKETSRNMLGFSSLNENEMFEARQKDAKSVVMREIEKTFKPELINRIDEIVFFREISTKVAKEIIAKEIDEVRKVLRNTNNNLLDISDDVIEFILAKSNISKYGAREIQRIVSKLISRPISRGLVVDNVRDSDVKIELNADNEITAKFAKTKSRKDEVKV